jgi:hypothetical protein
MGSRTEFLVGERQSGDWVGSISSGPYRLSSRDHHRSYRRNSSRAEYLVDRQGRRSLPNNPDPDLKHWSSDQDPIDPLGHRLEES